MAGTAGLLALQASALLADDHAGHTEGTRSTFSHPTLWSDWRIVAIGVTLGLMIVVLLVRRAIRAEWLHPGVISGTALLLCAYFASSYVVARYRKPGQMSVIEAQAMDMSAMRAPRGSIPVATERVTRRDFAPSVSYAGTVVAYVDQDIYPRVMGTIVSMPVYPGDRVKAGQLLVRLDDRELSVREQEARWMHEAARRARTTVEREREMATAALRQAEAELGKAREELRVMERDAQAARAMVEEVAREVERAERNVETAQEELSALQAAQDAMQAEVSMAREALRAAEADVESAQADVSYWDQEIEREKALLQVGAVSVEEYQREEAAAKTARAKLAQVHSMVSERKQAVQAAEARSRQAASDVAAAKKRVAAMEAERSKAEAARDRAEAEAEAAAARVEQARAEVRAVEGMRDEKAAALKAAAARVGEAQAVIGERSAGMAAARTVRGYTEIRATRPGYVTQRLVSPGVLVSPGTLILRIADITRVRLQAYVSAQDLQMLHIGGRVEASNPKLPGGKLTARITSIFPAADPRTRTSVVEAAVKNPGERLYPGDAVTMELFGRLRSKVLTVPNSAIVMRTKVHGGPSSAQEPTVWLCVEGKSEPGGKPMYTCVMHPEVRSDKPGLCPKCKMELVLEEVSPSVRTGPVYTCVMHPEVRSDKPGLCPKCKMELVPEKTVVRGGVKVAHQVAVTLGPTDGERTVVLAGLREGDEVIVKGHENIHEGDAVFSVPWGDGGPLQMPPAPTIGMGHTSAHGNLSRNPRNISA